MENFINKKSFCEAERERMDKLNQFQLPYFYKQLGIWFLLASLLFLFIPFFLGILNPIFRNIGTNGMLISMLLIVLSRDRIEDELTNQLRLQSYKLAFLFGVIFTFIQPFINNAISTMIASDKIISTQTAEIFPTLLFFLSMQMLFFYSLKKSR